MGCGAAAASPRPPARVLPHPPAGTESQRRVQLAHRRPSGRLGAVLARAGRAAKGRRLLKSAGRVTLRERREMGSLEGDVFAITPRSHLQNLPAPLDWPLWSPVSCAAQATEGLQEASRALAVSWPP